MSSTRFGQIGVVIYGSSSALIVSLCGMVGYLIQKESSDFAAFTAKRTDSIGILCNAISTHPLDDFRKRSQWTSSVDTHGLYICRTKNLSHAVDTIAEKVFRIQEALGGNTPHYLSCGNQSLAPKSGDRTAYFTRISKHQNVTETEFQPKIIWDTDTINSYIHPNISYNEGELKIPSGGIYFIYASLVFFLNSTDEITRPRSLSLRICSKHYGYERTLLGKTELYRPSYGRLSVTVNIAGQFLLREDDQILVRVSGLKFLRHHSKGNTFGLFPL